MIQSIADWMFNAVGDIWIWVGKGSKLFYVKFQLIKVRIARIFAN